MATDSSFPDLALLAEKRLYDPHRFLGLHEKEGKQVIRIWRPGADRIYLEVKGKIEEAAKADEKGLFEYIPPEKIGFADYRIYHQNGLLAHDPYAFFPGIGEIDTFLFNKGCHYELYSMLGANIKRVQGIEGVQFAVWAPNARSVYLTSDFNYWDGRLYPMRSMGGSGVWELFVPGIGEGEKYKFEIHTKEGYAGSKRPVAFYSEMRPRTASIVANVESHQWMDRTWMDKRLRQPLHGPMNVYEVHLGSWRNYGKEFPNYREIAADLAKYCKEMGFTHVELLPDHGTSSG